MADTQITIQDIVNEYGSYYLNHGQNMSHLLQMPFTPFGTREALTNIPTDETILRYAESEIGEILQPYQDDFTPKGDLTFTDVQIILNPMKVDQRFNPTKLVNSWLGFLTNNSTDRSSWPFIKWLIEVHLLQKIQEDIEEKAIYYGVFAAPVAGVAGPASGVMNGIRKKLNDILTGGGAPTPTGALSADPATFVTQVEEFVDAIPKKHRKGMVVNFNEALESRWIKGMRAKYNMQYAQLSDFKKLADLPEVTVAGRASMGNSQKIWATPRANAVLAVKGFANASGFEIEKAERVVKLFTDWWMGFGFLQTGLVYQNELDQD